jgi:hypothetical protein
VAIWSYAWTSAFVAPSALGGLTVTADADSIALVVAWTASADTYHYETLVEAQVGDDDWAEIGRALGSLATFTYYLAPLNQTVRIRISDSNGSQYSATTESSGILAFERWAMTATDGDDDYIQELRYVRPQETTDLPLDQVVIQPLSGPDTDTQLPIVMTGQWQGERIGFQVQITPADRFLIGVFRRAAMEPQGKIALKDPKGNVYIVQLGSFQLTDLGAGQQLISFGAIRIA